MSIKLTRKEVMEKVKLARKNSKGTEKTGNDPGWLTLRIKRYDNVGVWPNHFISTSLPRPQHD